MNSAINSLGNSSPGSVAGSQVNKTMHPQGSTPYGELPSHLPQNLGIIHTNTNAAHSHPNQQHHYSLNVPNTTGHYVSQNLGQIPASNHPVANPNSSVTGQGYSPQKNTSNYMSSYEHNISHQQNPTYPPVSQPLPASVSSQSSIKTAPENEPKQSDKPQSNGTSEVKSPQKNENTTTSSPSPIEKSVQPAPVPQLSEVQEKTAATSLSTDLSQLKTSESTNIQAQSTSPVSTSLNLLAAVATTTTNSTSSVRTENAKSSATTVGTTIEEPEQKKPKVDENNTFIEQSEYLKKNQPVQSDKIENDESLKKSEIATNDQKLTPKEKVSSNQDSMSVKQSAATTPLDVSAAKSTTRKSKAPKLSESPKTPKEPKTLVQKSPSFSKTKRQRIRTQPYQSPLPEVELISKISSQPTRIPRSNDERLIVFYKNEFLAVRNAEGSFYLCQAVQNIYKSSSKIKIRWLSQDKNDKSGEIYTPDFYDLTDFDCILTNLSLEKIDKKTFRLPPSEKHRTQSILNRSLAVEKGEVTSPSLTEEHPDGLDLSLYRDEDQLKKRGKKRKAGRKPSDLSKLRKAAPIKKSPEAPKVRKVSPPIKTSLKSAVVKKAQQPLKKTAAEPDVKKIAPSSKRVPSRGKRKTNNATNTIVDPKKAKVLAKIGRKTAVPAANSVQSNTKNAKSGSKKAVPAKKANQTKITVTAAVNFSHRNARRSTRK